MISTYPAHIVRRGAWHHRLVQKFVPVNALDPIAQVARTAHLECMENLNMRWNLIFVLTGLFALGCTKTHQYANPCQEGVTYVETDTARYCVAVVVRGGFECPAELPYQLDIGDGAVCSAERIEVKDLPDVICIEFAECISSDGGMREDATLGRDGQVETDGQVDVNLCSLPDVELSFEDIGSGGSGCPFGEPGSVHNGNATLIGASAPVALGANQLRVELDYCPAADDDCRCALLFDVGAERTSNAKKIAESLQTRVLDAALLNGPPVSLHTSVSTPTADGAWSVTMFDATALRETLIFAAARSRDLKEIVSGPAVFGGSLNVSWTGAEIGCGDPLTHRIAEQVQVTFTGDQSTATGAFGSVLEIDGDGGDRFSVWTTEAKKTLDSGGNATGVVTSAFFVPSATFSCRPPAPTESSCFDGDAETPEQACAATEQCFAPDEENIGVCQMFDDCNTEAFACGSGSVCETYSDPTSCSGTAYRCVEDCRVVDEPLCDAPAVCNESNGLCKVPSCLVVDGICDRFHECQPDGSCARVACSTSDDCDCGYCVNGACYAEPGTCQMPAP